MKDIFYFLIFPGFLFTAIIGLLLAWVDRKVTARLQWRVGPPWYQPFADFIKLMGKEVIIPKAGSVFVFLMAPVIGLIAVTLVSVILLLVLIAPGEGFGGDIIVALYLSAIPALSVIIGGFASRNSLASLGASREMKLMLSYELPFIIAVFVPVIISGGIISFSALLDFQRQNGIFLNHISAVLAFVVSIMCAQAKLCLVPFDAPEAEAEIIAGGYIEYSGAALALFKLTRAMNLFVMPFFLTVIFMGANFFLFPIAVIAVILIRNTNPRVRIDQATRFFWGPMTVMAALAAGLALLGY
ncbi:MAG: hypothetical protein COW11_01570 [Candidatus Omnitrophica bacterium CG12_big_fil_rev_8_21_14_0_65_43_15]|uniref:NADH-quinone oxidoreductase subunit H n=1 Tax=Candidatus Taenaricola geysiri TaxID=1974752 RepID=A0A2J0LFZ7_9BACT|nr:MAG: hypothetical protein AUJ89_02055 [Candidatus Omnitrophica bacterium CG1_02_43_210]PIR65857.1 MAG: hypothetical protein COU52_01945 [Candidatus Omnitrophica bacterium CG10_big_fil_rev_8_21_14_0_10_43_8]PIV11871.1 MAG: hypothetical protein COS48_03675 [Candidatus Omnitrophica bacterium CG03_land_8_20_14_0_80_43_22]PIW66765.1 MAG: hypothetical protein COW11_01570 [Candidatus Omnitrophica bacterium CG12_big_fil_rev_8_21_14_0_65_43_15]PIW80332.1 MAG: hypothetical protein COZ98_02820 [Candida